MLAIFKTGGKQYSVKAGQILKVEKLEGKKGDSVSFKDVLAIAGSSENMIGVPLVEGAVVEARILDQIRDKKIIVFQKRRRKNYRSTQGHRQYLTVLKIESISRGNKKLTTAKKEVITATKSKKGTTKTNETVKKIITKKTGAIKKVTKKTGAIKKVTKKTATKKIVKKPKKKDK